MLRNFNRGGHHNDKLPSGFAAAALHEDPLGTLEALDNLGVFEFGCTVGQCMGLAQQYITNCRHAELADQIGAFRKEVMQQAQADIDAYPAEYRHSLEISWKHKLPGEARLPVNVYNERRIQKAKEQVQAFADELTARTGQRQQWRPSYPPPRDAEASEYRYWLTVYTRAVVSRSILDVAVPDDKTAQYFEEKADRFVAAQIPLMTYMDDLADELGAPAADQYVDVFAFLSDYRELGTSSYPDDAPYIKYQRQFVRKRKSPRQVVEEFLEDTVPTFEQQAGRVRLRIKQGDQDFVKWLVYGTRKEVVQSNQERDADKHWKLPWVTYHRFKDAEDIIAHSYWAGMLVHIMQLQELRHTCKQTAVCDAAYLWQLAFLDLIDICVEADSFDDAFLLKTDSRVGLSVLEAYFPHSERAFFEGDLPNLGHTLGLIPLYGEQQFPEFPLGNIINKSMNFACVRRHLTLTTCAATKESKAVWKIISQMMWCMLAGTYSGSVNRLNGETALAMKRLCASEEALRSKLMQDPDPTSRIIFTAIRCYIVYYGESNPLYASVAARNIHWYHMVLDTRKMAEVLRGTDLRAQDPFAAGRMLLQRHGKNSNELVYRYKGKCLSEEVYKTVSRSLEQNMFRELEDCKRDVQLFQNTVKALREGTLASHQWMEVLKRSDPSYGFSTLDVQNPDPTDRVESLLRAVRDTERLIANYEREVPVRVKTNILNTLLKVPEDMRYSVEALSMLTQEEYGGLDPSVIEAVRCLVDLYYVKSTPRELEKHIAHFDTYHLRVLTWYLHCCRRFDRIHLIPLDAVTAEKIELAMKTKRVCIFPGVQEITDKDFEVYYTLCCKRVVTEKGSSFGHDDVRYNMENQTVVCKRKKRLEPSDFSKPCTSDAEVEERAKQRKTEFLHIPCKDQPVMRICIRGFCLQVGSKRGKMRRYMHCPECACFHQVKTHCFYGGRGYKCNQCLAKDKTAHESWKCAYCTRDIDPVWVERKKRANTGPQGDWVAPKSVIPVIRAQKGTERDEHFDPLTDPVGAVEYLYFCPLHYQYALVVTKRTGNHARHGIRPLLLGKNRLLELVANRQTRNHLRSDSIRFTQRGMPNKKD